MSQFKRFNASENNNFNSNDAYPEGTLTWDSNNGLRIHDGSTGGGVAVGGDTGYTRFIGSGIGSYDTNSGSSYNMIIAPNWDGEFPGQVSINLPSNENFGSPLQLVHNNDGGIQLITKNNATWTFDKDGNLTIPSTSGGMIKTAANASIGIVAMDDGTNNPAQMMSWNVTAGNPTTIVSTYSSNVTIQTDVTGTMKTWSFDNAGKLKLPAGGDVVDSNGTSVLGGSSLYEMKDANFTAESFKTYWLDSGTSAKTMTLPASPVTGSWVKVYDGSLNWTTYNLTVNGNGNQIRNIGNLGAPSWNSAASSVTLSQNAISPNGPLAAMFIWNGTYWYSAA